MEKVVVSICDIPIEIAFTYPKTRAFFASYLTNQEPILHFCAFQEDVEKERIHIMNQHKSEDKLANYSDTFFELNVILRQIAETLPSFDAVLFHGSAMAYKGKAYIFAAPSGTGKTTHSKRWLKVLPDSYILNGDKPILKIKEDSIYVYGTPWQGKENRGINEVKPLKAIAIIERDKNNSIRPLEKTEAFPLLAKQIYWPKNNKLETIKLLEKIIERADLYLLRCNKEIDSALISSKAMIDSI